MHVVAFVTHKQGLVEEGSEIQRAYTDYLRNHPDHPGIVVLHAGPTLADDAETIVGLLLVVEAPSLEAARAFLADSPYGKADVFAETRIQPWNWKTGRPG
ncbi:MAG: YciI family protein [Gammaproteobacteria bacterium]|nr:YciI family protein [Gammaproteobacteria bacterium]